jgi:glycosyltransferase involved in cell wall biosynthesis
MVLLEAMDVGVPVIATRVGGVPEALAEGRCGILFEPGEAGAAAESVVAMARDAVTTSELREAARRRVRSQFSMERMASTYDHLYTSLVEEAGHRGPTHGSG